MSLRRGVGPRGCARGLFWGPARWWFPPLVASATKREDAAPRGACRPGGAVFRRGGVSPPLPPASPAASPASRGRGGGGACRAYDVEGDAEGELLPEPGRGGGGVRTRLPLPPLPPLPPPSPVLPPKPPLPLLAPDVYEATVRFCCDASVSDHLPEEEEEEEEEADEEAEEVEEDGDDGDDGADGRSDGDACGDACDARGDGSGEARAAELPIMPAGADARAAGRGGARRRLCDELSLSSL